MAESDILYTTEELAEIIRVSTSTLNKWRVAGQRGPRFIKCGASVRYRKSDVEAFLSENARRSTSEYLA